MKLVSPVFGKEMVTLARRKRHFLARALLLGVLLAVVAVAWESGTQQTRYQGFMDTSAVDRQLFVAFTVTQLIAVAQAPMLAVLGLHASAKRRRSASAILQSVLVCGVWLAVPFSLWLWMGLSNTHTHGVRQVSEWLASMTPVTAIILLMERDFSAGACAVLIPCWAAWLGILILRFDKLVGRR